MSSLTVLHVHVLTYLTPLGVGLAVAEADLTTLVTVFTAGWVFLPYDDEGFVIPVGRGALPAPTLVPVATSCPSLLEIGSYSLPS